MPDFDIGEFLKSATKPENLVYLGFGLLIYIAFFQPAPKCVCK